MATEGPEKTTKRRKLQHNDTEACVGLLDTPPVVFLSDTRDRIELRCYCLKCKNDLGLVVNTWSKISTTHYTPTTQSSGVLGGLETGRKATRSPEGGNLGGCVVLPCFCKNCGDLLGVQCREAPEGKSQYIGRMFLKLRKMTLDKSPSGLAIEPQVEDTHDGLGEDLHEASPLPSRTAIVRDSKETDETSSRSAGLGEEVPGRKAVSAETSVELEAQRRDIDRIFAAVKRMERDIRQMKGQVEEIRSEAATRSTSPGVSRREGIEYPVDELELLTANITSIGAKVNGFEGLKLEFEMMKRRIKRMEDANNATQSTATLAAFPQQSPRATLVSRVTRPPEGRSQRKRTESMLHDEYDESSYQPGTGTLEERSADGSLSASRSSEGLEYNHKRPRSSTMDEPISASERSEPGSDQALGLGQRGSENPREDQNVKPTVSSSFVSPAKRHAPKATEQFFSYEVPIIDNSQDDDYRPGARSTVVRGASGSPKARGRTRGRGRGGRPRTSLNTRRFGTPEWEKPDWVDQPSNSANATGPTTASRRGGGVSRRGTGGGSYSEPRRAQGEANTDQTPPQEDKKVYRLTPRSAEVGSSTVQPRDQRQRDSEGYLLTAKGTRDGRSKFWKDVGAGLQPYPGPNHSKDREGANAGRHAKIMQQIFPDGVEEGKRRSNLAQQLFTDENARNGTNGEMDVDKAGVT